VAEYVHDRYKIRLIRPIFSCVALSEIAASWWDHAASNVDAPDNRGVSCLRSTNRTSFKVHPQLRLLEVTRQNCDKYQRTMYSRSVELFSRLVEFMYSDFGRVDQKVAQCQGDSDGSARERWNLYRVVWSWELVFASDPNDSGTIRWPVRLGWQLLHRRYGPLEGGLTHV
jgi:hypothetical protein